MSWYKTGLVEATSNSTIITGTGTSFLGNARIGDGIVIESGDGNIPPSIYEITNIASETQISIYPEYTGLGGEGLKYAVVHIMGYDKDLSDAFNRLRIEIGGYLANLQELDDWVLAPTQEAKDAAIAASTSALSASSSATNASTSASDALDSANSAELAKGLAQKWATSDELVDGLDYSAKKYAQDSSNSSQSAFTSAGNAAQSAVNAATSLSNIQDSEVNAATSASEAESWSEVAKDWAVSSDEVEGGLYSAKKYAEEAHSYTEGLADAIQDIYTQLQGKVDSSATNTYQGWYGTVWDSVSDTYFRTGAAGYTSIQSQMKRCVLNTDGTVNYFLHPDNSNFKEDGSASVLNGTDGNVMVQIPKFYAQYLDDGRLKGIKISLSPEDGFPIHPAFVKNGVEEDYRYYRAYEGIVQSGILKSISGVTPTRSFTFPVGRGYAKANGSGWGMIDYNLLFAVQTLMIVECNSMLSDQFFGTGNHTGSDYGITTGQSNHIGNGSSPSTNNDMWMSYRGIENFYADCWEMIDGINFSDRVPYINNNLDSFASDVFSGDYISTGITLPVGSGVYVSDYHFSPKGIFAKTVSGGSQVRAAGDGFWSNNGSRVFYHGGDANNGFLCGAFCFYSNGAASVSSVNIGAGISF